MESVLGTGKMGVVGRAGWRGEMGDTEHTLLWAKVHDSGDTQTSAFRLFSVIWLETQKPISGLRGSVSRPRDF